MKGHKDCVNGFILREEKDEDFLFSYSEDGAIIDWDLFNKKPDNIYSNIH